jgi:protein arginine kinase activator
MLCPSCKKREATIHITQNVNDKTTRIDLCPACAREQGYLGETGDVVSSFFGNDPFSGGAANLFKMAGGTPANTDTAPTTGERCAFCGTSYEEFRNRGLLGCCHCYDEFGQRLLPVIRRIQAGDHHTGRRPPHAAVEPKTEAAADAKPDAKPEAPSKAAAPSKPERKPLLRKPTRIPKKSESAPGTEAESVPGTEAESVPGTKAESELERLRREQAEAVKVEDYEKAARIRDRIKAIESGKEGV